MGYRYGDQHDLLIYVDFMKNQITELLTNYGPIGAIWLDGISTPRSRPDKMHLFKTRQLYNHIHSLQPQVLVEMLKRAKRINANLLLNTGPLPDGSIHSDDVMTLKEVGARLRNA